MGMYGRIDNGESNKILLKIRILICDPERIQLMDINIEKRGHKESDYFEDLGSVKLYRKES